ncbi:MAG: 6-carboxytetrahydropterin synthase [Capsulimonadaceae bacterium]|nr:6-carboxytetrahydropterin synthase [Capsulimonadaceae bacterium]
MIVDLKRRVRFSAAHNYWINGLSLEQNESLFGAYARAEGHGHNYLVEVTASGGLDERTGMVVNIAEIDHILKSEVVAVLDGRFLNKEVEYFLTRPATLENISAFVFERTSPRLPTGVALTGVRVWETTDLWADRTKRGETMSVSLTRAYDFSASHRLHSKKLTDDENREIFGKCNNPNGHGHNYEVEVTISGEPDERTGMLYSLEALDQVVEEEVLLPFDHKHLNLDVPDFADRNPTSEVLTVVIWERLARRISVSGNPRLSKVLVRETARNSFEYRGEEI